MPVLLHNPRCTKSRQAKQFLEDKGEQFEVREYLKDPLNYKEMEEVIQKLGITPMELIRTNEKIWKENYKGKDLTDSELIQLMVDEPKLMQRPIYIKGDQAVVGRPTEKLEELL